MNTNDLVYSSADVQDRGILCPYYLDVICGRGVVTAAHPGNIRFRAITGKYCHAYQVAKSKKAKMQVNHMVMDELRSSGRTRFLKKHPVFESYSVAGKRTAGDKITHFLKTEIARRSRINDRTHPSLHRRIGSVEQVQQPCDSTSSSRAAIDTNASGTVALVVERGIGVTKTVQPRTITVPSVEGFPCEEEAKDSFITFPPPFLCHTLKQPSIDNNDSSIEIEEVLPSTKEGGAEHINCTSQATSSQTRTLEDYSQHELSLLLSSSSSFELLSMMTRTRAFVLAKSH